MRAFSGEMSSFSTAVARLALGGLRAIPRKMTGFCYHVSTRFGEDAPSQWKGSPQFSSTSKGRGAYGCSYNFTHVSSYTQNTRKHFPLSDERKLVQLLGKGRYAEALTILGIPWGNREPNKHMRQFKVLQKRRWRSDGNVRWGHEFASLHQTEPPDSQQEK